MPLSAPQTYKGHMWGLVTNKNGYPKRKKLKPNITKRAALTLTSLCDDENSEKGKVEEVIGL